MKFKTYLIGLIILVVFIGFMILQFINKDNQTKEKYDIGVVRLATTTSTQGSGLLDKLIPAFEQGNMATVEVMSRGTGIALQLAREGKADVVLVHARSAEDAFIGEGFGINRRDVMYNDFVLLGPPLDPANVKHVKLIDQALISISKTKVLFASRGDNSGTHIREQSLWAKTGIRPAGGWYYKTNKGMLATLQEASAMKAYVLSDRSTYLHNKDNLRLEIVLQGDHQLYNPYGVIAVNPIKVKGVNLKGAMAFINFITSPQGQDIILRFGLDNFGEPLFTPMNLPTR